MTTKYSFSIINTDKEKNKNRKDEKKMIKVDKRKKYLMVLDVETTNNQKNSKFNYGLVYDIVFLICDK